MFSSDLQYQQLLVCCFLMALTRKMLKHESHHSHKASLHIQKAQAGLLRQCFIVLMFLLHPCLFVKFLPFPLCKVKIP